MLIKRTKKGGYINTWFLRGNITSVLNVVATPNCRLCELIRKGIGMCVAPDKGFTKVIEQ